MNPETAYEQINRPTRRDYPRRSLHDLIDECCERTPDQIAVLAGEETLTYSQLRTRSNELANHLRATGIGPGDLVGLCCDRAVETPALLIGIMKSGAGYVPLDPDYPIDRLLYMVDNSEVKHVVCHSNQRPLTEQFATPTTIVDKDWEQVARAGAKSPPTTNDPEQAIAYVILHLGIHR